MENPEIKIWFENDDHSIAMIITNSSIIEFEGELVPGLLLNISGTLELIKNLADNLNGLYEGQI